MEHAISHLITNFKIMMRSLYVKSSTLKKSIIRKSHLIIFTFNYLTLRINFIK